MKRTALICVAALLSIGGLQVMSRQNLDFVDQHFDESRS